MIKKLVKFLRSLLFHKPKKCISLEKQIEEDVYQMIVYKAEAERLGKEAEEKKKAFMKALEKSAKGPTIKCPDCGGPMSLQTSQYKDRKGRSGIGGKNKKFFRCMRFPHCRGAHSATRSGEPLGIPADAKTRQARKEAHKLFDTLWKSGRMSRRKSYEYMQKLMDMTEEEAHISKFTTDQCLLLCVRLYKSEHADLLPTNPPL